MVRHPKRHIFVEGGGDNDTLRTQCRRGFTKLLEKAGFAGKMPRINACGGRHMAYERFCTALNGANRGDVTILLVDAEAPVTARSPWDHVKGRPGDGWERPKDASDEDLHFMVECMENWFLADKDALAEFFGRGFRRKSLPANPDVEEISKLDVYGGLKKATGLTTKGAYGKGAHSFTILALVDPAKVRSAAPYAERLLDHLDKVL